MPPHPRILILALLAVFPPALAAQASNTASARNPGEVTLVAAANLPNGARTVVLRRARQSPGDLILVNIAVATAEDLASGFDLLTALRAQFGERPAGDIRATPKSFKRERNWDRGRRATLERHLRVLANAPVRQIGGYGRAPSLSVMLPAPNGRFVSPGR